MPNKIRTLSLGKILLLLNKKKSISINLRHLYPHVFNKTLPEPDVTKVADETSNFLIKTDNLFKKVVWLEEKISLDCTRLIVFIIKYQ